MNTYLSVPCLSVLPVFERADQNDTSLSKLSRNLNLPGSGSRGSICVLHAGELVLIGEGEMNKMSVADSV